MIYPTLDTLNVERDMIETFGGYNHVDRGPENTFYDMMNCTSDNYPTLSPRRKRGTVTSGITPRGLIAKDALCYIDGSYFCMNDYRIDMGLNSTAPKQLVSMGAYVIILPDKKYINTADVSDFGNIDASFTTNATVTFSLAMLDGADVAVQYVSSTEPSNPDNMDYWIDTSSTPHALKVWSSTSSMWTTVATTYVKVTSPGIGAAFSQYDGISIDGLAGTELHDATTSQVIDDASQLSALNGSAIIWAKGDDWILIVGIIDQVRSISDPVTVSRTMPELDFVVESENRLWGCRYGLQDGKIVNEIYASKLGDFKNWRCYMGTSTDSYTASVGTDGQFTGAITHLGYPIFFKENFLHKVYGNYPANFQIQTTACRGVQKGSWRSLAIVNEVLYYHSRFGIMAYDGSLPEKVSEPLGDVAFQNAVGGALDNKYYFAAEHDGASYLFIFDSRRGMWHREDNPGIEFFCGCNGEMYFYVENGTEIRTMLGTGTPDDDPVTWNATSAIIGTASPDKKYIANITVRMALELGTEVDIYAQYDSEVQWRPVFHMRGTTLRSFAVPVRPRRCDHLRLKFEGTGPCKIFSIAKTIEDGSDL